ncbi:hypothetical protein [Microbacterium sp. RG1]|uniref:hypothetical protein n=1 Tax=Microbacterium sp. RG1 TaxID=2489212 RepID=UPI0010CA568E|nr:hypothetical protein [Microbacterium sp. RG1]QCQ16680.1 hypothetical protein EHF32_08080 [Microbacterium sp. RG1]
MMKTSPVARAGTAVIIGVGSATLLILGSAAIFGGPASYGLTPPEAVAELGTRPAWVIGVWVVYCVAVLLLVLLIRRRNADANRRPWLSLLDASLWACGAVGTPWLFVVNAAWGPLLEEHDGAVHEGVTRVASEIATYLWLSSVASLLLAVIVGIFVRKRPPWVPLDERERQ